MEIEDITIQQYVDAFNSIGITDLEKKLIVANYEFPEHIITSRQMAKYVGFAGMAAANSNYGRMAKKFCKYFDVNPRIKVKIFVNIRDLDNKGWRWILHDNVVRALEKVGWVNLQIVASNPFQDLENFKRTKEYKVLEETTRDAVVKSRLGQGVFRAKLVEIWDGCSVTGCKTIEVLRASHIKPWRSSSNSERLDPYNGLLLLPKE